MPLVSVSSRTWLLPDHAAPRIDVTNEYEFIIVGSQSILGPIPYPPEIFKMSAEADIYPRDAEEKSTQMDGVIGEGSQFHTTYGYYAQGVDSRTATLPHCVRAFRIHHATTEQLGFSFHHRRSYFSA